MRIVGGTWRGKRLEVPKGSDVTRPTTDRTREAVSSMVASAFNLSVEGLSVLDAFAGSGALGFEMLSRGASHATFIERDRASAAVVRANAASLGAARGTWSLIVGDAVSRSRGSLPGAPFDVVFLDPPYAQDPDLSQAVAKELDRRGALGPDVLLVHERALGAEPLSLDGFEVVRSKKHGTTVVELLRREDLREEPEPEVAAVDAVPADKGAAAAYADGRLIDHVVVPGTFDPVTRGHLDVIRRAVRIAPTVTVAVAASKQKHGRGTEFTLDERIEMLRESLADVPGSESVRVLPMEGLLVDFCRAVGAGAVVKGLRAATDFEYELAQADLNVRMAPAMESIFVMSSPEFGYVSSSVVREIASLGGDVSMLVTPVVAERLRAHYGV